MCIKSAKFWSSIFFKKCKLKKIISKLSFEIWINLFWKERNKLLISLVNFWLMYMYLYCSINKMAISNCQVVTYISKTIKIIFLFMIYISTPCNTITEVYYHCVITAIHITIHVWLKIYGSTLTFQSTVAFFLFWLFFPRYCF